jgi:hypothetical protein
MEQQFILIVGSGFVVALLLLGIGLILSDRK